MIGAYILATSLDNNNYFYIIVNKFNPKELSVRVVTVICDFLESIHGLCLKMLFLILSFKKEEHYCRRD